jgi:hypothetical protein
LLIDKSGGPIGPFAHLPFSLYSEIFCAAILLEEGEMLPAGCSFESEDPSQQNKTWMDCFGCGVLDPWKHLVSGENIVVPPYVPSAALGMYAKMLTEWMQYFPAENMRALNYQQLVDNTFQVVNDLLRFMGTRCPTLTRAASTIRLSEFPCFARCPTLTRAACMIWLPELLVFA